MQGVGDGLEPALGSLQTHLENEIGELRRKIAKVGELRVALGNGQAPAAFDLASLTCVSPESLAAFDLPWPWGGERFELRGVRALNYIVGPLGSGKTRFAKALAQNLPDAVFLGLERFQQRDEARLAMTDPDLRRRIEDALAWLMEDGATASAALSALVADLELGRSCVLIIDMIEQQLDEPTQQAVMAHLRRQRRQTPPRFILTRSSAILDPSMALPDEMVIFCPANHSPPVTVQLVPGAAGYDALASCLGSLEVRARTEGMVATMPGAHQGEVEAGSAVRRALNF